MRCKQGDLAIVIGSEHGHDGKIVHCVKWLGSILYRHSVTGVESMLDSWAVDPPLARPGSASDTFKTCPEQNLRPIGNPGEDAVDETIQRLGKPTPESVAYPSFGTEADRVKELTR